MPGIVGIISNEAPSNRETDLNRMAAFLQRRPTFRVDNITGDHAALAGISLDQEPALARQDGIWLAFNGLIVQTDLLRRRLQLCGLETGSLTSTSELLLTVYRTFGLDGLLGLNGSYSIAIWEEAQRKLTLLKDRLGIGNMYYWHSGDRLMFASEYKAISWHPQFNPRLDDTGVADFFIHRRAQSTRTFFADIRSLPSAGVLVFQDGQVRLDTYWKPTFWDGKDQQRSSEEYSDELYRLLTQSVQRRLQPNTCILLTGGLDSRALAGIYQQLAPDMPPLTATVGHDTCVDVVVARQIARALGYTHHFIPTDEHYLEQIAARTMWRAEGKLSAYAGWIYLMEDMLAREGVPWAMTGLFGDNISGRHFTPDPLAATSLDEIVALQQRVVRKRSEPLKGYMRPDVYERITPESMNLRVELVRAAGGADLLNRWDAVAYEMMIARIGQGPDVLGDAARVFDPFLDNDVIDFALGMPVRVRAGGLFYKRMIVKHLPKVAAVTYGRTGYPVSADLEIRRRKWLDKLDHWQRQLWKRMNPEKYKERACIPQVEAMRGASYQFTNAWLKRADLLDDYFDMNKVRAMLVEHVAGKPDHWLDLSSVLSFALWREQFVERKDSLENVGVEVQVI